MRKQRGITLIALVLTIIILLILAGVAIATLTGDNGLLTKAGEARNTNIEAEGLERIQLAVMASHDNRGINTTLLAKNLSEISGLTDKDNQAITENTEIILPKSFNLNDFKYKIKLDGIVVINNSLLPDEYQEVEYIKSTGIQYIDTEYVPNANTKYEYEFSFYEIPQSNTDIGGIDITNVANQNLSLGLYINGKIRFALHYNSKINIDFDTNFHSVVFNNENHEIYVDNTKIYRFGYASNYTNSLNLYLFATNNSNTSINMGKLAIKHMKIYDKNILKRNFIPCYSTTTLTNVDGDTVPSNTKGLYDIVEGKFYTNQGTGDFIAGPEI